MAESSSVQQFILGTPVLPQPGPTQDFVRGTPINPIAGPIQDFIRATPINPIAGATQDFIKGAPISHVGIRGPQTEQFGLQLDRLINDVGNLVTTTTSIDLTSAGTTTIFSATQKTFIMGVIVRVTAADTVTGVPSASVGIDPQTDNVFSDENMVSLDQINDTYNFWNNLNTGNVISSAENLILSINTAATATTLIATVYVIGVFLGGS